jgi:hypothetical protein
MISILKEFHLIDNPRKFSLNDSPQRTLIFQTHLQCDIQEMPFGEFLWATQAHSPWLHFVISLQLFITLYNNCSLACLSLLSDCKLLKDEYSVLFLLELLAPSQWLVCNRSSINVCGINKWIINKHKSPRRLMASHWICYSAFQARPWRPLTSGPRLQWFHGH